MTDGRLESIMRRLEEEMSAARNEYTRALDFSEEVVARVKLGTQHPDGVQAIENAGKLRRAAFLRYRKSILDYQWFLQELAGDGASPRKTITD